ncbi:PAS domain S-box protein [uncultured Methanoregula sp.]|uniref:PAS domain S-box protein n=1 Tax=uncultured Methanoregula sp. TaxID=1005933 RepID=UPI002AAB8DD2|nr:PAS domain S-box protein [uncultured Methanoregula sp.]
MNFRRFFHNGDPVHFNRILAIVLLTVVILGVNLFGILYGLTAVLTHLLYLPTILASYWYPRRGLLFSAGIAVLYGILVILFVPMDTMVGIVTITRMAIIMLVGCIVALLSMNLAESEQKLQDIIEFLPDAVFAINREGKVIAWNRAVEEMTGKQKAEMLGRSNFEYSLAFYGERRPMLAGLILKNESDLLGKYPTVHRESSRFVSEAFLPNFNSGRGAHLRFSATALMDPNGNVTGAIESVRDITEQVMTKSALENTGNRLNTLAGIIRHDMSKKLAVIYGELQFGVMKFRDPDVISFIASLKESVNGIKRQIDISREFRDIGTTPPAWIAVQDAIEPAIRRLDFGKVIFHVWTERLSIFSDPHLPAVFYHLLHNSTKESTGATRIIITYHIRDNGCAIIIEDNGTGIPDAEKGTLFVQREDSYGRGLFLATEIVSITGITLRETGVPGNGARFEILVPPEGYRVEGMEQ